MATTTAPSGAKLTKLETYLLSMYAYTQRDVREMHAAVKVLQTSGLIDEDQYDAAVNLVSCSRPHRKSIEELEKLILVQFQQSKAVNT